MRRQLPRTEIPGTTFLYLALLLLTVPARWIMGMMTAALIHEAGHLCAIRILRIPITRVKIGMLGATIETQAMTRRQELICAIAGPVTGVLPAIVVHSFPVIGLFAMIQTAYNMIPIYPSDGARVLRCLLPSRDAARICGVISQFCVAMIGVLLLWLMRYKILGFIPAAMIVFLVIKTVGRKIPCKDGWNNVQ